ncbi:MAG: PQQ-like beta-propeller repeat protein [Deltaproteobacteria bacterium]|nr:PQQ-like beta-propeller repeat protein [Deltaproteobacteria bacterium]
MMCSTVSGSLGWGLLAVLMTAGCGECGDENLLRRCEGLEGLGGPCTIGKGVCEATGIAICAADGDYLVCDAVIGTPSDEVCDGLDNDCDGETDEQIEVPTGTCLEQGVCAAGVPAACVGTHWQCDNLAVAGWEETEVSCDNLDNDCDGEVDEGLVKAPDATCHSDGVCATGVQMICDHGHWFCDYSGVADYEQFEFTCDSKDNDCDGETDEYGICQQVDCSQQTPGTIKCSYQVGASSGMPAIDGNGVIYTPSRSPDNTKPSLVAINPATCAPMWEFVPYDQYADYCNAPIVTADNKIYLSCGGTYSDISNAIYIIDSSGTSPTAIRLPVGVFPQGLAVGDDGTIYFGETACCGAFYAINPDGSVKWVLETGGSEFREDPAIGADGTIYAVTWKFRGSPPERAYAIADDGTSGRVVWEFEPPESSGEYDTAGIIANAAPAIGADGTVYVVFDGQIGNQMGFYSTTLYALDPTNGHERWHHRLENHAVGMHESAVTVGADNAVYFFAGAWGDGATPTTMHLSAVNSNGTAKWSNPFAMFDFAIHMAPAIGADGNLYVAAEDKLYSIDASNGSERWRVDLPGNGYAPTISSDGTIYVQTTSAFYAVCSDSGGLANAPWPKRLHDLSNRGNYSATQ